VRLDLFVLLKYESSTIMLFASIRYSMRDLLSDLNSLTNDVSACSGISSP